MDPLADDDVDRLVDDTLRELSQPSGPDLKSRVMAAWDAGAAPGARTRRARAGWWESPAVMKPAGVLAGALVIFLGMFLVWQHTDELFRRADRLASRSGMGRPAEGRQAPAPGPGATTAGSGSHAGGAAAGLSEEAQANTAQPAPSRPTRRRLATVLFPLEDVTASSAGPDLPGAPAGELGDPIEPLPRAPAISISPIVSGATISEIARPVSEFPADEPQPAGDKTGAGPTEGVYR